MSNYDTPGMALDQDAGMLVIDSTPVNLAALVLVAGLALVTLKWAGFKFNVGVSN